MQLSIGAQNAFYLQSVHRIK